MSNSKVKDKGNAVCIDGDILYRKIKLCQVVVAQAFIESEHLGGRSQKISVPQGNFSKCDPQTQTKSKVQQK